VVGSETRGSQTTLKRLEAEGGDPLRRVTARDYPRKASTP
jgi:hypothetical protein